MIKDFPTSEEAWNAIACRSVEKAKAEARKSGTAISGAIFFDFVVVVFFD